MAQLEHVAEQHETIDPLQRCEQRCTRLGSAQQIHARDTAEVQVRDD
jgi:hypothetical protein